MGVIQVLPSDGGARVILRGDVPDAPRQEFAARLGLTTDRNIMIDRIEEKQGDTFEHFLGECQHPTRRGAERHLCDWIKALVTRLDVEVDCHLP